MASVLTPSSRVPPCSRDQAPSMTVTDFVWASGTYATGGEAITAATLGLNRVHAAIATVKLAATTTVNVANVYYNISTGKLLAYDETPAEVANAADLVGLQVQVIAWGR